MNDEERKIYKQYRLKRKRLGLLLDAFFAVGWALVSVGTAQVNLSAGLIVSGVLLIGGGVLLGRGLNP